MTVNTHIIFFGLIQQENVLCFLGTIAEGAPIIPVSAQLKYNIDVICEYIVKKIPVPKRDFLSEPRLIGKNVIVCCNVSTN